MSTNTDTHTLKSNVTIQRQSVTGYLDADPEEAEILGYVMFSTTGDLLVPRDWLLEIWEEKGLPEALLPEPKWPSSAYKLAMSHLIDKDWDEKYIHGQKVTFNIEEGDNNVRHVYANVHFREDQVDEPGGVVRHVDLGVFNYNAESQKVTFSTKVDEEQEALYTQWTRLVGRAQGLFEKMKKSHTGQDMRTILLSLVKDQTTAIPLRSGGAVYFFPAGYESVLDPLAEVWDEMNTFKKDGKRCRLTTIMVIDNDDYRRMIEEGAEEVMADAIDSLVEAAFEKLEEDEEETAEELATGIIDDLAGVQDIADDYGTILETKLSVKRHLERWLTESKGDKQAIVQRVLDQRKLARD